MICLPPRGTSPHQDSEVAAPTGTPPPAQPPQPPQTRGTQSHIITPRAVSTPQRYRPAHGLRGQQSSRQGELAFTSFDEKGQILHLFKRNSNKLSRGNKQTQTRLSLARPAPGSASNIHTHTNTHTHTYIIIYIKHIRTSATTRSSVRVRTPNSVLSSETCTCRVHSQLTTDSRSGSWWQGPGRWGGRGEGGEDGGGDDGGGDDGGGAEGSSGSDGGGGGNGSGDWSGGKGRSCSGNGGGDSGPPPRVNP